MTYLSEIIIPSLILLQNPKDDMLWIRVLLKTRNGLNTKQTACPKAPGVENPERPL